MLKPFAAIVLATLAVAACGGSSTSNAGTSGAPAAATASAPPGAAAGAAAVHLSDFKIMPAALMGTAGVNSYAVTNDGPTPHNLSIKDASGKVLARTSDLKPGERAVLTLTLTAGSYTAFCALPGHESLGMKVPVTIS